MISTEITVGDKNVIDSGFVTAYDDDQIRIKLKPDKFPDLQNQAAGDNNSLIFIFEFIEEEDEEEPGLEVEPIDDNTVKYQIKNHLKSGVMVGGVAPRKGLLGTLEVAEMEGRKVLLNYQVSARVAEEDNQQAIDFYYTFYQGGEVDE